jgi:hypothetical protein
LADLNGDVTGLVCAYDPRPASGQLIEGGWPRVPELVAGAHADDRVLRLQSRQHAIADRPLAAMMPDLEHIDVAEHAFVDEWLEHVTLGVPGQHRREPLLARDQHHARFVGRGVLDRRRG